MAKTQEEFNELKEEIKTVNEKLSSLTEEELEQIFGGFKVLQDDDTSTLRKIIDWLNKIVS